nr:family 20 glycosylhydrolase [Clostridia bacterium]
MYIGSLNKYLKGYEYYKRGTKIVLAPDAKNAENDNIFDGGNVTFAQLNMLNTGFDLHVELTEECFVDSVVLSDCTGYKTCEVYVAEGASLRCVARADKGTNPVAGVYTDKLIIRFQADWAPIAVKNITVTGAIYDELNLYPQPASVSFDSGDGFDLTKACSILCDTSDEDSVFAAEYLKERLAKEHGVELEIKPLGNMFRSAVIIKKDISIAAENYRVRSMPHILSAMAGDRLGLLHAAVTILNAIRDKVVRPLTVNDHPYMPFRGAHFGLPRREQIPFFKTLIKELLVPMHYNTLFIEVAGGMKYDSHPEITEAWNKRQDEFEAGRATQLDHAGMVCGGRSLEKDEVRDIVNYAKSFGIEVIPEIQSLSHVQYITNAHPEIGEVTFVEKQDAADEFAAADIRAETKVAHCFCAADPRSYEILFDIAEEVIEVFQPKRYVHMGHDEVYEIGVCERCRDRDPAELLAEDINKIHDWLKK